MKGLSYIILLLLCFSSIGYAQKNVVQLIESGKTPLIDGVVDEVEWADAKALTINGTAGLKVIVLVTYDAENLYVAFKNLMTSDNVRLNSEVMVHTDTKHLSWNENCYWFHSSYGNCSAIGQYYYWEDCTANPMGWDANSFPFKNKNNNIEFKISFSKLNTLPKKGQQIKIAFKLSNPLEQHSYWPETATIANPLTWGTFIF